MIMPYAALRPCSYPGCIELIRRGSYCEQHNKKLEADRDMERGNAAARGYDARWRRLRKMYLAAYPICVDPFNDHGGQVIQATEVDHKVPRREGGSDEWSNLQALCKHCHSKKGAKEGKRWS